MIVHWTIQKIFKGHKLLNTDQMSEKIIEHTITHLSEYKYGYLNWHKKDQKKYRNVFPEGKFDLIFNGRLIPFRKVDWHRNRLNLYPVRDLLNVNEIIIFQKKDNKIIAKIKE